MTGKIKDALNYKFPISIIGIIWILTTVIGVVFFADTRYFPRADACRMESTLTTLKIRQDYVLINQTRMCERLGIAPIQLPNEK